MRAAISLALLALAALAATAGPPSIIRYQVVYNSTTIVPAHGTPSKIYIEGILVAYLVKAEPPLYTFTVRLIPEKVDVKSFPGNNTVAARIIASALVQGYNITVDASSCRIVGVSRGFDMPIYCYPGSLAKLGGMKGVNVTVKSDDGRVVVEASSRHDRVHAVYSKDGLLLEARIVTETVAGESVVSVRLLGTGVGGAEARSLYARALVIGVGAGAAAGAATLLVLRRRRG